jgi:type I restriction enzyme S subunit
MTWERRQLEEVADLSLGKMLDQNKNRGELLPYLANINVRWGEFDLENLRKMPFEHREMDRYGLRCGDIVMCEGGEPGRCAIWKDQRPSMMIQKAIHRIRPHEMLDYRYLYYFLAFKGKTGGLSPLFTGATIKHLPRQQLAKVEITIPPLTIQKAIASVVENYDRLIENNHRRIALLEESAKLLFKEWFVQRRFPGHEHFKIVKGVPKGWTYQTIEDVAETVGGGTPSTGIPEYWEPPEITWFSPTDITNNEGTAILSSERKISERGLQNSSAKLLPPNTILMTSRASIGFFAIYDGICATNQGFISVIPKNPKYRWYILLELRSRKDEIVGRAGGTTFKEINKTTFRGMPILVPHESLVEQFGIYFDDILDQVKCLKKQIKNLEQARDILLPMLLNGDIAA